MAKNKKKKHIMNIFLKYHQGDRSMKKSADTEISKCTITTEYQKPSNKVQIYANELEILGSYIQDYQDIETGGQLFGSWTASGAPRILYVIGPGPNANHQQAFFNQDIQYLEFMGTELKKYGLQHIGEWHSHHCLGLPSPSGHDAHTIQNNINRLDLNRFCLCIGSIDVNGKIRINPYNFCKDSAYEKASWEVIHSENRLRRMIDTDLGTSLIPPISTTVSFAEEYIIQPVSKYESNGWFSDKQNKLEFKHVLDALQRLPFIKSVKPQMNSKGRVLLNIEYGLYSDNIQFPDDFPTTPFIVTRTHLRSNRSERVSFHKWIYNPGMSIYEVFMNNYKPMLNIYG